jgi:hypothetical protein
MEQKYMKLERKQTKKVILQLEKEQEKEKRKIQRKDLLKIQEEIDKNIERIENERKLKDSDLNSKNVHELLLKDFWPSLAPLKHQSDIEKEQEEFKIRTEDLKKLKKSLKRRVE